MPMSDTLIQPAAAVSRHGSLIKRSLYQDYLEALLQGNRHRCSQLVNKLLDQGVSLKIFYEDLFKKSLYHVGVLWENNRISVAREHLASSLTESLMTQVYPLLFDDIPNPTGMVVISCTANELHQIGGKMVADMLELNGWDTHFLGANTPVDHLIAHMDEIKPDLLGLSLSIYSRLPELIKTIEAVKHHYPQLDILAGGQAFLWGGKEILDRYPSTTYIPSLSALETELSGRIDVY